MESVQNQISLLRKKLDRFPALDKAEDATKIPKEYLVLSGGFAFFTLLFFGIGASSVSSIIGFVYPAYKSLQAIGTKIKNDDTQWLIYWIVFAFFTTIESFTDTLLYWIPFYFAFKMAFLLWAMLPQTKGAKFLYDKVLEDFLKKNESRIDAALEDARRNASTIAVELSAASAELSAASLSQAAEFATQRSISNMSKSVISAKEEDTSDKEEVKEGASTGKKDD